MAKTNNYHDCKNAREAADIGDFQDAVEWLQEAMYGLEFDDEHNAYRSAFSYVQRKANEQGLVVKEVGPRGIPKIVEND